jgi:hypothetical protein
MDGGVRRKLLRLHLCNPARFAYLILPDFLTVDCICTMKVATGKSNDYILLEIELSINEKIFENILAE